MAIRRYAVYANFGDAALDPEAVAQLSGQRAMHIEVVSAGHPLKIAATVSAFTMGEALASLAAEVAKVCPGAAVVNANAIEVQPATPAEAAAAEVS